MIYLLSIPYSSFTQFLTFFTKGILYNLPDLVAFYMVIPGRIRTKNVKYYILLLASFKLTVLSCLKISHATCDMIIMNLEYSHYSS